MPHCVIECSADLADIVSFETLVKEVHDVTESSGLFSTGDVKARLVLSDDYWVGGRREHFVHIICHILSGRTVLQRKQLADSIVVTLCGLLPSVEMLSVDVREIDKNTYSNKKGLQ